MACDHQYNMITNICYINLVNDVSNFLEHNTLKQIKIHNGTKLYCIATNLIKLSNIT